MPIAARCVIPLPGVSFEQRPKEIDTKVIRFILCIT